ncbi:site-specific integrase [Phytobacter diazotrophicus]|uniref:tyrosine-type recombinase/integrase n=1 Tax=Phytobacter diazotrophicus TaxID=395631 RepID=UPI002FF80CBB
MCSIRINTFIFENGERYCHVVNKNTGEPLYYPNLYITTQLRNRSESISTMEVVAGSLSLLYRFLDRRGIDIVERITTLQLLSANEIDNLSDFASKNFKDKNSIDANYYVKEPTKYFRITVITTYFEWLCNLLLSSNTKNDLRIKINTFISSLKKKRPADIDRYKTMSFDKGLSERQLDLIFTNIKPLASGNPFVKEVQNRNFLIVLLLYSFGIRSGEMLNLRISDIDFYDSTICIRRRPNDKSDPRVNQPLVKTSERKLYVESSLMKMISDYVIKDRRSVKGAGKNEFLFVTYKKGQTQGMPLSISSYHKIIKKVRDISPELVNVTGHKFRHRWNYEFSNAIDTSDSDFSEAKEEQVRNYIMGWATDSETAKIYNKRHIDETSKKVSIAMQKLIIKGIDNDAGN